MNALNTGPMALETSTDSGQPSLKAGYASRAGEEIQIPDQHRLGDFDVERIAAQMGLLQGRREPGRRSVVMTVIRRGSDRSIRKGFRDLADDIGGMPAPGGVGVPMDSP
jgi:hypothetical protein